MLAKVIKLTNEKGGKVSVQNVLDYLSRDEKGDTKDVMDYASRDSFDMPRNASVEGGTFNLEGLNMSEPMDRDMAVKMMDYISQAGQQKTYFKTNPIYHYALSWRDGEHPDQKQVREAVEHTLKALGMEENQAFYVIHRDKESHHHVHVIANRVHPDKLTLSGPPRFDYLVLDKSCRELENLQGWQHDNGPNVVVGDDIKRLTKAQRKELGLVKEGATNHAQTPAARMYEVNNGTDSFAEWSRKEVAPNLISVLNSKNPTWEQFHKKLAEHGITAERSGGGLTFSTESLNKTTTTKASGVDYRFSLGRLEKSLGAYQASTIKEPVKTDKTFLKYVDNVISGKESGEYPAQTGKGSPKREEQRLARAKKREELADRYKLERLSAKDDAALARSELRLHQIKEREKLKDYLKTVKPTRMQELTEQHGSKKIASAIWATEKVIASQNLEATNKLQKADLKKKLDMSWPSWLERQALNGDVAAISALKGIRYKEQRKKNQARPGFEGEDLGMVEVKPQEANSIGGEVKKFQLSSAEIEIDYQRQRIAYKDSDGNVRLVDSGPRVDVLDRDDKESMQEGLLLAKQKFGGEVFITGDAEFREKAAREAARMNIKIADKDLQHIVDDEKKKQSQERGNALSR